MIIKRRDTKDTVRSRNRQDRNRRPFNSTNLAGSSTTLSPYIYIYTLHIRHRQAIQRSKPATRVLSRASSQRDSRSFVRSRPMISYREHSFRGMEMRGVEQQHGPIGREKPVGRNRDDRRTCRQRCVFRYNCVGSGGSSGRVAISRDP